MSGGDFSPDQKRYLEGFVSGLNAARAARSQSAGAGSGGGGSHTEIDPSMRRPAPTSPSTANLRWSAMCRFFRSLRGKRVLPG